MTDLIELRKLAEDATQGEWCAKLEQCPYPNWYLIYSEQVDPPLIVQVLRGSSIAGIASHSDSYTEKTPRAVAAHANAAYIAAANPATVITLLDQLQALEQEVEEIKSFWKEAMLRNRNMLDELQTLKAQMKQISDNNIGQLIETSQNLGLYDK
jgi:LPS O-antigen subunit length determinant protein (WzzB/FepE family)